MIKSITVTNYLGDSLKLELTKPENSGFVVTSIEGLGPGKANINTVEVATNDGALFNSARLPSRNIVISLLYLWQDSIEDTRQRSYQYFPLKTKVNLLVETDNRLAAIDGYVESNEPDIFTNKEGADISIVCANPYFYSMENGGVQTTLFSGVESMFEFPFSNESLSVDLLNMGEIQNRADNVVVYKGDAQIGITIKIHAIGEASDISIYNTKTYEVMHIDTNKLETLTGSGVVLSDDIEICTVRGSKYAKLFRAGVEYNILNCIERDADWFQLSKGDNVFAYTAETGATNLQFKIENRILYEGV